MSWRELVIKGFGSVLVLFQQRSSKPEGLVWLPVCDSGAVSARPYVILQTSNFCWRLLNRAGLVCLGQSTSAFTFKMNGRIVWLWRGPTCRTSLAGGGSDCCMRYNSVRGCSRKRTPSAGSPPNPPSQPALPSSDQHLAAQHVGL